MNRVAWVVVSISACLLSGCTIATNGPSASGTLPGGRTVSAESDRPFRTLRCRTISPDSSTAVIGRREVFIGAEDIRVDGATVASIPATARNVTVSERAGRLVVIADSRTVYESGF